MTAHDPLLSAQSKTKGNVAANMCTQQRHLFCAQKLSQSALLPICYQPAERIGPVTLLTQSFGTADASVGNSEMHPAHRFRRRQSTSWRGIVPRVVIPGHVNVISSASVAHALANEQRQRRAVDRRVSTEHLRESAASAE